MALNERSGLFTLEVVGGLGLLVYLVWKAPGVVQNVLTEVADTAGEAATATELEAQSVYYEHRINNWLDDPTSVSEDSVVEAFIFEIRHPDIANVDTLRVSYEQMAPRIMANPDIYPQEIIDATFGYIILRPNIYGDNPAQFQTVALYVVNNPGRFSASVVTRARNYLGGITSGPIDVLTHPRNYDTMQYKRSADFVVANRRLFPDDIYQIAFNFQGQLMQYQHAVTYPRDHTAAEVQEAADYIIVNPHIFGAEVVQLAVRRKQEAGGPVAPVQTTQSTGGHDPSELHEHSRAVLPRTDYVRMGAGARSWYGIGRKAKVPDSRGGFAQ